MAVFSWCPTKHANAFCACWAGLYWLKLEEADSINGPIPQFLTERWESHPDLKSHSRQSTLRTSPLPIQLRVAMETSVKKLKIWLSMRRVCNEHQMEDTVHMDAMFESRCETIDTFMTLIKCELPPPLGLKFTIQTLFIHSAQQRL